MDPTLFETMQSLPCERIKLNQSQPRKFFEEEELEGLKESIQSVGLIQPLIVSPLDENYFELVAGERRFRAALKAGLKEVPVVIKKYSSLEASQAALVENIQRVDLNPMEIARAIHSMMIEFSLKQEALAAYLGKKRSTIANYLRLLTLPKEIQDKISSQAISMGHAKALLSLEDNYNRLLLCQKVIQDKLSVRETEAWVHKMSAKKNTRKTKNEHFHLEEISQKLQDRLGTQIELVEKSDSSGKIMIHYYSSSDLERLLELLITEEH